MRITGGNYKGKLIETVKGQGVRPTSAKIRESIFNIIRLDEVGTVFYEGETIMLDLFAGSGIMGFEAISRGAKRVVFVERSPRHAAVIKKNIINIDVNSLCHCEESATKQSKNNLNSNYNLITSDALKALDKLNEQFNFIFIDPPYDSGLYEPVLAKIQANNILSDKGFIVLEYSSNINMKEIAQKTGFKNYKTKIYGDTGLSIISM